MHDGQRQKLQRGPVGDLYANRFGTCLLARLNWSGMVHSICCLALPSALLSRKGYTNKTFRTTDLFPARRVNPGISACAIQSA